MANELKQAQNRDQKRDALELIADFYCLSDIVCASSDCLDREGLQRREWALQRLLWLVNVDAAGAPVSTVTLESHWVVATLGDLADYAGSTGKPRLKSVLLDAQLVAIELLENDASSK
ncbi:MAG: hypothetical protein AAGE80_11095 [Pseudomonadota bacterium]